jgi:glucokinase
MILAGDIGGNNCRLAVYEHTTDVEQRSPKWVDYLKVSHYVTDQQQTGWRKALQAFLNKHKINQQGVIQTVCLGMAGPVEENEKAERFCKLTNVADEWLISEADLREFFHLDFGKTFVINDMEAIAYAIPLLKPNEWVSLNEGTAREKIGNRALIAAGTGLGELIMVWNREKRKHLPSPSEGGHTDFAPCNEEQRQVWEFAKTQNEQKGVKCPECVCYEQVVSGSGLVLIYQALTRHESSTPVKEKLARGEDPAPYITATALQGDLMSKRALEVFMQIYGAEAGNLALKYLARNGVYLGGGISPQIWHHGKGKPFFDIFLQYFAKKPGRFAEDNAQTPVRLILNTDIGLMGAAKRASEVFD